MQPLSILCRSLHDIDTYTTGFPRGNAQGQTDIFRAVKHCLPGPVRILVDYWKIFMLPIVNDISHIFCLTVYFYSSGKQRTSQAV